MSDSDSDAAAGGRTAAATAGGRAKAGAGEAGAGGAAAAAGAAAEVEFRITVQKDGYPGIPLDVKGSDTFGSVKERLQEHPSWKGGENQCGARGNGRAYVLLREDPDISGWKATEDSHILNQYRIQAGATLKVVSCIWYALKCRSEGRPHLDSVLRREANLTKTMTTWLELQPEHDHAFCYLHYTNPILAAKVLVRLMVNFQRELLHRYFPSFTDEPVANRGKWEPNSKECSQLKTAIKAFINKFGGRLPLIEPGQSYGIKEVQQKGKVVQAAHPAYYCEDCCTWHTLKPGAHKKGTAKKKAACPKYAREPASRQWYRPRKTQMRVTVTLAAVYGDDLRDSELTDFQYWAYVSDKGTPVKLFDELGDPVDARSHLLSSYVGGAMSRFEKTVLDIQYEEFCVVKMRFVGGTIDYDTWGIKGPVSTRPTILFEPDGRLCKQPPTETLWAGAPPSWIAGLGQFLQLEQQDTAAALSSVMGQPVPGYQGSSQGSSSGAVAVTGPMQGSGNKRARDSPSDCGRKQHAQGANTYPLAYATNM
jgi:hypothetical protein